jgi:hypothetical protein
VNTQLIAAVFFCLFIPHFNNYHYSFGSQGYKAMIASRFGIGKYLPRGSLHQNDITGRTEKALDNELGEGETYIPFD